MTRRSTTGSVVKNGERMMVKGATQKVVTLDVQDGSSCGGVAEFWRGRSSSRNTFFSYGYFTK